MPTTHYLWDEVNDTLLAEADEAGNTIAEYTHEPGQFGPLISQRRNGHTYYHHYDDSDGQGSTRALTDESGNVTDRYNFTAFGETVASSGTTANPFGYKGALGYYANSETNDIYVRARTYQPVVGRWLSQDPIGREFGIVTGLLYDQALYCYVHNSPLQRLDPSGLIELTADAARKRCNKVIEWKKKQVDEEKEPPKIERSERATCGLRANELKKNNPALKKLWDQFRQVAVRCTPDIECICCKQGHLGSSVGGDPDSGEPDKHAKIQLCWNNLKDDPDQFLKTLLHETTHSLQSCSRGPLFAGECEASLKREMEAYFCEGLCHDFTGCLQRAINSSCGSFCTKGDDITDVLFADLQKWVTANEKTEFCKFPRADYPARPPKPKPKPRPK